MLPRPNHRSALLKATPSLNGCSVWRLRYRLAANLPPNATAHRGRNSCVDCKLFKMGLRMAEVIRAGRRSRRPMISIRT